MTENSPDTAMRTKHSFMGHVKVIAIAAVFGLAAYAVLSFVIWVSRVVMEIFS